MSFSPYGHNLSMLETVYPDLASTTLSGSPESSKRIHRPPRCSLLSLPNELLASILREALPCSGHGLDNGIETRWMSGSTAISKTCRRLYDVSMDILYGENEFMLSIAWHASTILIPMGSESGRNGSHAWQAGRYFFTAPVTRRLSLLKYLLLRIEIPDPYVISQKFNIGLSSVEAGLKTQVEKVCSALKTIPDIEELRIMVHAQGAFCLEPDTKNALKPLLTMQNVKGARLILLNSSWSLGEARRFETNIEDQYISQELRKDSQCVFVSLESGSVNHLSGSQSQLKVFPSTHYLSTTSAFYLAP